MDNTDHGVFAEWVILELMGHRRLAGFLTEQEIAGRGFLRLEIPAEQPVTQLYNPTSVYAITPTTREIATAVAQTSQPAPVQRWELPAPEPMTTQEARSAAGWPDSDHPF